MLPTVTHPVTLHACKMPRRHSRQRHWCSCRAGVTEVSLSLTHTHTLRTWSQRQTHTVRTDACLKGSFPLQAEGQRECLCVIFVNWGLSCRSLDKRNSSSTRFSTRSADRFLTTPHVIYTGTLHSNQTQQAWTGVKQHVDIWVKYEKCFRHLGHINSISLTTLQCAVTTC